MKFSNGMWMAKEGYRIQFPKEAYTGDILPQGLRVYGPYVQITRRGNTLDGGLLTLTITAPCADVLSVRIENHRGLRKKYPQFPIQREACAPTVEEADDHWCVRSGKLSVEIGKGKSWGLRYFYNGVLLTGSAGKAMAYIQDAEGRSYIREQLELDVGENIYGLGERFTPFVKNGQSVDIWNEDGGTDSEQSYKNIPFFLSSKGYGVLVNHTGRVSFEVGSESVTRTQFSVPGESMEYFLVGGDSLKEVLANYVALSGKPALMPQWSFGLWLSTSFTTNYDEQTVLEFIDGMLERDIPLSVFHFDCFWMKEFEWSNFLWDDRVFPDPAGLIQKIHHRGIRVSVWINPYIAQKSPLFQEGYERDYFINTGSGDVWQWDRWQAGMAVVDFTNPAATRWFQEKLGALLDMGVDSFKTDFGERIPFRDSFFGSKAANEGICYHDGSDAEAMHNYYTYLYNQTVFELLEQRRGKGEACLFSRSATVGCQKYPLHWGGDNLSSYPSMAESLRGGLSFGLCGFPFWSHDIGGFESGCTPDIYMRWTQFGLLSSHSRYHGNQEYKVPWMYGAEAVEVTREFTKLKNRLMPYLYRLAVEAIESGVPLLRPMLLEFPQDPTCRTLDRQYMLGESLLVAPIFGEDGWVEYYLPQGQWTNLLTHERICGPGWRKEHHGYQTLPLLVREGTLLPLGSCDARPDYDYTCGTSFILYSPTRQAEASLYDAKGTLTAKVKCEWQDDVLLLQSEGSLQNCTLQIPGTWDKVLVEGGTVSTCENKTIICINKDKVNLRFTSC